MARTTCLVCFISTVNGLSKKKRKKKKPIMSCASNGHITILKQSIFAFRYLWPAHLGIRTGGLIAPSMFKNNPQIDELTNTLAVGGGVTWSWKLFGRRSNGMVRDRLVSRCVQVLIKKCCAATKRSVLNLAQ
jgi:hypothetical protein